jgi:uncharacterized RDD family membrane protein YckC
MLVRDRNGFGGFWLRVGAYFVDAAVLLLPTLLARFLYRAVTPVSTQIEQLLFVFGEVAITTLVWWVYTAAFWSSSWQATVGMRVCCLKVVDYGGRRVTFGRASARYFASFLSALLCIGFMMVGWTRRRQGLHDLIAQTLVLKMDT